MTVHSLPYLHITSIKYAYIIYNQADNFITLPAGRYLNVNRNWLYIHIRIISNQISLDSDSIKAFVITVFVPILVEMQ